MSFPPNKFVKEKLEPSPEVKDILQEWTKMQEETYGLDWKAILAKKMTDEMLSNPVMNVLLKKLSK